MKNVVAVIDFGSSRITTLVGEMGVNNTLNIYGKGEISYAGFQNSRFLEPEYLFDSIKSSISRAEVDAKIKINEIYVGIPGEFTAVVPKTVSFNFPRVKKITNFDINSIFRTGNTFEKEVNYCLINKSVLYYELDDSNRVINPEEYRTKSLIGNVSYVLALRYFVDHIGNIFSKLKVNVKGYISSILAESLYLIGEEHRKSQAIILDIGYLTTSVGIVQENGLLMMSSFSLGGAYVSSDLSQCLRIPFDEAELLKDKIAISWVPSQQDNYTLTHNGMVKNYSAKATNEIAFDRIEVICKYVQKCLDDAICKVPNNTPIYLTGGGLTQIKGIKHLLSQKFKRPIFMCDMANNHRVLPYNASSESLLYFVIKNAEKLDKIIIKN